MRICGICQRKTVKKFAQDIFQDTVGNNPSVSISELLIKLTTGVDHLFVSNEICRKCTKKLSQYYSAKQLLEKVEAEILFLLKGPASNDDKVDEADDIAADQGEEFEDKSIATSRINEVASHVQQLNDKPIVVENLLIDCNVNSVESSNAANDAEMKSIEPIVPKTNIDCSNSVGVATFRSTGKGKPTGIKCECCDKIYENHKTFEAHKKRGDGFSGYVCELCGTTLFSKSGFSIHAKSHQPQKDYQCVECGAQFQRKSKLNHHLAWHKGEKPFQCEICAKCFVHRVALTKHRHIHSDATRRNECQVCGNKFRTLTHLTRHMSKHTGAKPYSCPVCGKCFSQAYNMRAHIKQHENSNDETSNNCPEFEEISM